MNLDPLYDFEMLPTPNPVRALQKNGTTASQIKVALKKQLWDGVAEKDIAKVQHALERGAEFTHKGWLDKIHCSLEECSYRKFHQPIMDLLRQHGMRWEKPDHFLEFILQNPNSGPAQEWFVQHILPQVVSHSDLSKRDELFWTLQYTQTPPMVDFLIEAIKIYPQFLSSFQEDEEKEWANSPNVTRSHTTQSTSNRLLFSVFKVCLDHPSPQHWDFLNGLSPTELHHIWHNALGCRHPWTYQQCAHLNSHLSLYPNVKTSLQNAFQDPLVFMEVSFHVFTHKGMNEELKKKYKEDQKDLPESYVYHNKNLGWTLKEAKNHHKLPTSFLDFLIKNHPSVVADILSSQKGRHAVLAHAESSLSLGVCLARLELGYFLKILKQPEFSSWTDCLGNTLVHYFINGKPYLNKTRLMKLVQAHPSAFSTPNCNQLTALDLLDESQFGPDKFPQIQAQVSKMLLKKSVNVKKPKSKPRKF